MAKVNVHIGPSLPKVLQGGLSPRQGLQDLMTAGAAKGKPPLTGGAFLLNQPATQSWLKNLEKNPTATLDKALAGRVPWRAPNPYTENLRAIGQRAEGVTPPVPGARSFASPSESAAVAAKYRTAPPPPKPGLAAQFSKKHPRAAGAAIATGVAAPIFGTAAAMSPAAAPPAKGLSDLAPYLSNLPELPDAKGLIGGAANLTGQGLAGLSNLAGRGLAAVHPGKPGFLEQAGQLAGQVPGHLARNWPLYAAGGIGGLGLMHYLQQRKKEDEDEGQLWKEGQARFSQQHPFVAGFLARCSRAQLSGQEIQIKVATAVRALPELRELFEAALGVGLIKQAEVGLTDLITKSPTPAAPAATTLQPGTPFQPNTVLGGIGDAAKAMGRTGVNMVGRGLNGLHGAFNVAGGAIGATGGLAAEGVTGLGQAIGLNGQGPVDATKAFTNKYVDGTVAGLKDVGNMVTPTGNLGENSAVNQNLEANSKELIDSGHPGMARLSNMVDTGTRYAEPIPAVGGVGRAVQGTRAGQKLMQGVSHLPGGEALGRGMDWAAQLGSNEVNLRAPIEAGKFIVKHPIESAKNVAAFGGRTLWDNALIGDTAAAGFTPERIAEERAQQAGMLGPDPAGQGDANELLGQPAQPKQLGAVDASMTQETGEPSGGNPGATPGDANPGTEPTPAAAPAAAPPATGLDINGDGVVEGAPPAAATGQPEPIEQAKTQVQSAVQQAGVSPEVVGKSLQTGVLPADVETKGKESFVADMAKTDPTAGQDPSFMDQMLTRWNALSTPEKWIMGLGLGIGALGLINSVAGEGGAGSWLMSALGLAAVGGVAANQGMMGPEAQKFVGGIGSQVAGMMGLGGPPAAPLAKMAPATKNVGPAVRPAATGAPEAQITEGATNPNLPAALQPVMADGKIMPDEGKALLGNPETRKMLLGLPDQQATELLRNAMQNDPELRQNVQLMQTYPTMAPGRLQGPKYNFSKDEADRMIALAKNL